MNTTHLEQELADARSDIQHLRRENDRLRYHVVDLSRRLEAAEREAAQADELLSAVENEQ